MQAAQDMRMKISGRLGESQADYMEGEWSRYKIAFTSVAEETLGVKEAYTGRMKITPWWTERVQKTVKSKMQSFRKWMKTRPWEDRQADVIARNEAERLKLAEKKRMWVHIGKGLEDAKNTIWI